MNTTSMNFALTLGVAAALTSCTETECATPDFNRAECRVLAENGFARVLSSSGVELRFQRPGATKDTASWSAEGIVVERGGVLTARVAHMGDFALSLRNTTDAELTVELELDNVHPRAVLEADAALVELSTVGTKRQLEITVPADGVTWVRGGLGLAAACTSSFRVLVLADVQTNPTQFSRIIERIAQEASDAEAAGELLTGVVMPGDLTESSSEDEFRVFADLLETATVPFALTPGNHDVYSSTLPFYNQNFGPGNYSFNVCDVHVAMLDTGSGSIADSVVGRLPELFDADGAAFSLAAMHHPPYAEITGAGWSREDLAMLTLGEFAHQGGDLVLAGHAHMLRDFSEVPVAGGEVREII
ncbi:metallophosphoesterase family protein, partial [Enhygromyxa salina]|uniref:metallophosphoesterase family protein n=1 Tax=Enhygromyxa salina TaxID=215803 RepID=UPI0011B1DA51